MALIVFCVFFVVPDDQTCTEKCGRMSNACTPYILDPPRGPDISG